MCDVLDRLTEITAAAEVDWNAFDAVLASIDDMNRMDEDDETLLTEFIMNGEFFCNGKNMYAAIEHFLSAGYDVSANGGKNGTEALKALCWSSYDQYVFRSAKLLLDAGAPTRYSSVDVEHEDRDVLSTVELKLSGAWTVDKDYNWANILEAYHTMLTAAQEGADYDSVELYTDCIGKRLEAVQSCSAFSKRDCKDDAFSFDGKAVMWFEGIPLNVSAYVDMTVNPIYVRNNRDKLMDESGFFSLGHRCNSRIG